MDANAFSITRKCHSWAFHDIVAVVVNLFFTWEIDVAIIHGRTF